ncbi:MAE_28990/MAE_18760 family HEPN-like nuclease, partial [Lactococcus garvieae]|uniref:MAE_28990/MAE_18760 family HEPN-like nuclease n=1 Tax=Lactococcus garvieae TaxID=1363 RepID=UPI00036AA10B
MINEYEKTKQEIELFCQYLISSDKPETLILEDKVQNSELVKILKSSALMMLYNLVEATIRSCITQYYDSYNEIEKSYSEAGDKIKKLWLNYNSKFSKQTFNEELYSLIDKTFSDSALFLDIEQFHLSGNADLKETPIVKL